jgi:hypothetical protein
MRKSRAPGDTQTRSGSLILLLLAMCGALAFTITGGAATFTQSAHVNFRLEGCRNDGSITFPSGGPFICPDEAYTTGNLGKGWNELDLVPHRLTTDAGTQAGTTTAYNVVIAADYFNGGTKFGYDAISAPVVNAAESDSSCSVTATPQAISTAGVTGGAQQTIYRTLSITQDTGTTCVFDYYQRLALGAHLYNGSSLQSYMFEKNDFSTGKRTLSIPVNEIAPQAITKDMTATQGTDHVWDVTKDATPATVSFGNTCDLGSPHSAGVQITVSWEKKPATASGPITVITHVYATNPAARVITTSVSDDIRSGTTVLDTAASAPVDVPANTANFLVLTHQTTVPDGTTNLNDVATATYTDKDTGIPVPGTSNATASAPVQLSGPELNQTATIDDIESISGSFQYSADSFSGATGSFQNSYLAGTKTSGSVEWLSDSQSGDGSVSFDKTIYVGNGVSSSGTLSDTATLNGSDGFTKTANASLSVSADARVTLTINKSIPDVLQGSETETFNFDVYNSSNALVASPSIHFGAGDTSGHVDVSDLAPGTYTVKETGSASGKWSSQPDQVKTIGLPSCSGSVSFANNFGPAAAKVKKVTNPAGHEAGWEMTLNGPGTPAAGEKVTTTGTGFVNFGTVLQEGSYTITETSQAGWDETGSSGCSFTVDYPADSGNVFECTKTNRQRAKVIVKKVTNPSPDPTDTSFSFTAGGGLSPSSFSLKNGGQQTYSDLLPGNGYSVAETVPAGWDLTSSTCDDGSPISNIDLSAGETVTCTFTNRLRGKIIIRKITNPSPDPSDTSFSFTAGGGLSPSSFSLKNGGQQTYSNVVPGNGYSAAETVPAGWDLTSATCDDGSPVSKIDVGAGETVTCTFTNTARGKAKVIKTVSGLPPSGTQSFTFQLRQGASPVAAGSVLESGTANAGNGGVINFTTYLVPGQTYQLCEQMLPGWTTTLGPPLYSVYNPSGDNSVVCTDFTVAAGATKTFAIDNKPPPGGMALTIGYWKNWSSCTGGGQKPTLDQTLLKMAQGGNPETLGLLVLNPLTQSPTTVCNNAVSILSKQTLTGKKMASDPLFNMAAQLLAADLNVGAGAGQCAASASAINQAHALLTKYNFDGNGYSPKLTTADANLANSLATTLDKYNNNKLC